jgi:hypothetical protein
MAVTILRKGYDKVVIDENTSADERAALLKQGFTIDKGATIETNEDGTLAVVLSPTKEKKAGRPKLGAQNTES